MFFNRYGIFITKERNDVKLILSRLFGECITVNDFEKILAQPSCNIDKQNFLSKLDVVGLSRNYFKDNEIQNIDLKNKKLYDSLKDMCNTTNNYKQVLELGIIETVNYLSDDFVQYLRQNPIISFTLIFLHYSECIAISKETNLKEMFNNGTGLVTKRLTLPKDILDSVIFYLPYLKSEVDPKRTKNNITMYQLLDGYKQFNSTTFFKWRLRNGTMPDFLNENLVKKFGHKEKLSYINYLKEARPHMAANILRLQQEQSAGGISAKA